LQYQYHHVLHIHLPGNPVRLVMAPEDVIIALVQGKPEMKADA